MEAYALSLAVALMTVMLVALLVLATRLESLGRRYYVSDVVGLMGMTSLATACLVGLFVLFLIYGPVGRNPHHQHKDAVVTSEAVSAHDEGRTEDVPPQTDAEGIAALPRRPSE